MKRNIFLTKVIPLLSYGILAACWLTIFTLLVIVVFELAPASTAILKWFEGQFGNTLNFILVFSILLVVFAGAIAYALIATERKKYSR